MFWVSVKLLGNILILSGLAFNVCLAWAKQCSAYDWLWIIGFFQYGWQEESLFPDLCKNWVLVPPMHSESSFCSVSNLLTCVEQICTLLNLRATLCRSLVLSLNEVLCFLVLCLVLCLVTLGLSELSALFPQLRKISGFCSFNAAWKLIGGMAELIAFVFHLLVTVLIYWCSRCSKLLFHIFYKFFDVAVFVERVNPVPIIPCRLQLTFSFKELETSYLKKILDYMKPVTELQAILCIPIHLGCSCFVELNIS